MEETPPEAPKFNMPQVDRPEEEKIPDAPLPSEIKEFKPPRSKKKIIILVLALFLIVGGVVWYFVLRDKDTTSTQSQTTEQQTNTENDLSIGDADTVPYAFKAADAAFDTIFWRDTAGGDRTEVGPLGANSYISQSAVSGQNVAYVVENMAGGTGAMAVWLSRDGGKNYEQLLELSTGDQVTSLVFSTDNSAIAVALLKSGAEKNKVSLIELDTKQETTSFEANTVGVFLEAYHAKKTEVIYFEGCYNCDANVSSKLQLRKVPDNSVSTIADAGDASYTHVTAKADFSEVVVSLGTQDGSGELGADAMPPYTIQQINLNDETKKDIGTVATGSVVGLGYQADGKTPYYAYGNLVVSPKDDGTSQTLYEASAEIVNVYYVSSTRVIASTGTFTDFVLRNYDISAASEVEILNGDGNAHIFGVTTKQ